MYVSIIPSADYFHPSVNRTSRPLTPLMGQVSRSKPYPHSMDIEGHSKKNAIFDIAGNNNAMKDGQPARDRRVECRQMSMKVYLMPYTALPDVVEAACDTADAKSCNTRTRWSNADSIVYCVRCEAIAGEAQTEVFAPSRSRSPCCRACQITGRLNREPARLRGATKGPNNILMHIQVPHEGSAFRRPQCVALACDSLRRHRKICPRGEIIVVLGCHWPEVTK
jgi:hypothetical protein